MYRVLVACEESQTSLHALLDLGCDAYSCDIQKCSGKHPDRHIQGDVTPLLKEHWDMIIAHPPCTYLTASSSTSMFPVPGVMDVERFYNMQAARDFFMLFYNHPCKYMIIENPRPLHIANLPPYNQVLNPFDFGADYSKRTCFWYHGFPFFLPTHLTYNYRTDVTTIHRSDSKSRSKSDPLMYTEICRQAIDFIDYHNESNSSYFLVH